MNKITKNEAVTKIKDSGGRIFNVNFMKKDGTPRSMTARRGVKKYLKGGVLGYNPDSHALITVYDINKKAYRSISAEKIYGLAIDGIEYEVE